MGKQTVASPGTRPAIPSLRAVEFDRSFLEKSRVWFADADLRDLTATPPIDPERQEAWFVSLPLPGYHLWGVLYDDQPVGVFGIKNVADAAGEYWGYIGEKQLWGVGIGRWMMQIALTKATRMGLRRLWLRVLPDNERAIALYRKFAFRDFLHAPADGFLHLETDIIATT